MVRATGVQINATALLHNLNQVHRLAPKAQIIAMVKANAYGCGLGAVAPVLDGKVYAFGVACLEEAMVIRKKLGLLSECILFQGVFSQEEWQVVADYRLQSVVHQAYQLESLLAVPLSKPVKIWVKINTGMNRLGFDKDSLAPIMQALVACPWVEPEIGVMTHFACADEPFHPNNQLQVDAFRELNLAPSFKINKSLCNSAAIFTLPEAHADMVRPGIMLYGVSPFAQYTGKELNLIPVMRFVSAISAIHPCDKGAYVGYGGIWRAKRPSLLAIVAAGYGDGYPRHISQGTPVWINGMLAPIVGRVSMDMLTIDITDCPDVRIGNLVELWGPNIPVENVAASANTIPYDLLCRFAPRARPS